MMRCSAGMSWKSEFDGRYRLDVSACRAEVEEILAGEAEHAGEQRRGHLLDAGVVFLNRVGEEAAAGGDLVLEVGQLARQLLEVGVGLEVRIGLGQRDQLAERAAQLVFGGGDLSRSLRGHRGVAGLRHVVERAALVRGVALHGLEQIRDQIVALLELHVDLGKGLADALAERHQPVIRAEREENENNEDADNDPAGRHGRELRSEERMQATLDEKSGNPRRKTTRARQAATNWVSPWSGARRV